MEFLVPAVIVIVTALVKSLTKKYGIEMGRAITLILAFALSGIAAYFYNVVDAAFWKEWAAVFATQMAIYEVFVKSVLKVIFEKSQA